MRRCERHCHCGIAFIIHFDPVNQAKIIDVDWNFGIVNLFESIDHRFLQRAACAANACTFRLLRKKPFEIIALAL